MPIPQTIQLFTPVAEPIDAERIASTLIADSDLALQRLVAAVQSGFESLWGTKDSPKPKAEAQAALVALGADAAKVFARHKALVTMLVSEGLATFEAWETTPAYVINEDGTLGDLTPEWTS